MTCHFLSRALTSVRTWQERAGESQGQRNLSVTLDGGGTAFWVLDLLSLDKLSLVFKNSFKEGHADLLCGGWEVDDWPLCISAVEAPLAHVPLLPATSFYILHLEPVDLILVSVGGWSAFLTLPGGPSALGLVTCFSAGFRALVSGWELRFLSFIT